jgi:ATP-dependent 26S proteasome regulatory subunit
MWINPDSSNVDPIVPDDIIGDSHKKAIKRITDLAELTVNATKAAKFSELKLVPPKGIILEGPGG